MLDLSDAHHTRKLIAGMCMMFAPLCLLAGAIVEPAPARGATCRMTACLADAADVLGSAGTSATGTLTLIDAPALRVGLRTLGRTVLIESDEEWEHTPQVDGGLRPLSGRH